MCWRWRVGEGGAVYGLWAGLQAYQGQGYTDCKRDFEKMMGGANESERLDARAPHTITGLQDPLVDPWPLRKAME